MGDVLRVMPEGEPAELVGADARTPPTLASSGGGAARGKDPLKELETLLDSAGIGTVFLDEHLRVQHFTANVEPVFALALEDVGKPIFEVVGKIEVLPTLAEDAAIALRDRRVIEREVRLHDAKWLLIRIGPHRAAADDVPAGVVATLIDVTRQKLEVETLSASREQVLHRFKTVMMSVPDFVYQFDLEGRFTYISPSLLGLWQKTNDEALGKNFYELDYPPELAAKLQRQIQEVVQSRRPLKDETPYTSAFGERMYEYLFFPLLGEKNGLEGVGGVTRDITERKLNEQALRESEQRFRAVTDNVPQLIWTNNADGVANFFNRRWYDYTGLREEESFGPGWQAIVHPDDAQQAAMLWEDASNNGKVFETEYRLRRHDGTYRWHLGRNVPVRNGEEEILSWFGTATDIEERKRAEAALRETQERFGLLVEGARDYAMFLLDTNNLITYWNSGAEKVFGWKSSEAVGQSGELIFTPEDRAREVEEKEIEVALRDGVAPDRRWHLRKDGSRIWVDGVMRRLDDEQTGALRGFAKIARDASDQKAVEEALRRAKDEMEERVRERTRDLQATNNELERTMSQRQELERELLEVSEREKRRIGEDLHDMVCQELTATALFLKSTAKQVAEKSPSAAQTLEESAQIVNRNVGLTRDLARGLQPAELTAAGLKQALRLLAEQACENTKIKCHFKATRGVRVTDDTAALHLYRVTQEAIKNAVKHAEAKNILISLDKTDELVCVSIEDDGKGFTPTRRSKGLGLHIMRYRANALGGELQILKRKSGGTEVRCKIPLKRS